MITKKITLNPISRIEGHGKVTILLDEEGEVQNAYFHVTQFRGFERFCEGRPFEEMPVITQRICGICPVSHQLGSAKACDAILGVEIPDTARLLRELLHMGQFIQSHALHFFHLASPDLLLGWDADPAIRNVIGVIRGFPEIAKKGIRLRKFGQEIIKALGGKKVHPAFSIPGGVTNALSPSDRDLLLGGFDEAYETCGIALDLIKTWVRDNRDEVLRFANFESSYAGLVDENGRMNLYDGKMRVTDSAGKPLEEFEASDYLSYIGEQVEPWSYLKFPFFKNGDPDNGWYRVGPLGRLRMADGLSTTKAGKEYDEFSNSTADGSGGASLLYHYARLIELLYALERAEELLTDDAICGTDFRVTIAPSNEEGVGIVEAPRGTLIHHYWVDRHGTIEKANLIVATGHNNMAMNRSVQLVAKEYIHNGEIKEGILNRVEAAIRCYDPCLSCSTHAFGQMPLEIRVVDGSGETIREIRKG